MQPVPLETIKTQMLALNSADSPFTVAADGNVVTVTWNLVDAKWYEIFSKAGMKEAYTLEVKLNPNDSTASYTDRHNSVTWEAGVPHMGAAASMFKGKEYSHKMGVQYGVKEDLTVGEVFKYDFDTKKIKNPVFSVLDQNGWKLKRSWFDKLFG